MVSVAVPAIGYDFSEDLLGDFKVNSTELDHVFQDIYVWQVAFTAAVNAVIADDNTLMNGIVDWESLHPEVQALIAGWSLDGININPGTVNPGTSITIWIDESTTINQVRLGDTYFVTTPTQGTVDGAMMCWAETGETWLEVPELHWTGSTLALPGILLEEQASSPQNGQPVLWVDEDGLLRFGDAAEVRTGRQTVQEGSFTAPTTPTPVDGDVVLVIEAVSKHAGVIEYQSLASPGYVKFSSGLIVQWGEQAVPAQSWQAVALPTAFATACLQVMASVKAAPSWGMNQLVALGRPMVGVLDQIQVASNDSSSGVTVAWLAIGY